MKMMMIPTIMIYDDENFDGDNYDHDDDHVDDNDGGSDDVHRAGGLASGSRKVIMTVRMMKLMMIELMMTPVLESYHYANVIGGQVQIRWAGLTWH